MGDTGVAGGTSGPAPGSGYTAIPAAASRSVTAAVARSGCGPGAADGVPGTVQPTARTTIDSAATSILRGIAQYPDVASKRVGAGSVATAPAGSSGVTHGQGSSPKKAGLVLRYSESGSVPGSSACWSVRPVG